MDPRFAIQLDNWFPDADSVRLRRGYTQHADIDAIAKTLYAYDVAGTQKLIAFTDAKIIDVTSASTSDLATGLGDGFWATATHGQYGIFVNGTDTPRKYDGSTVTTTTFTGSGLTATDLYGVHSHNNRLYLWTDNATSFWYSGVDAIAGSLSEFDLAYVHQTRGKVVAMATWTFDGGAGVDDVLAIIMSSGQVFIYSGSNPGDATNWSLVGVFNLGGRPIGRRCVTQYGGDAIILTENGYFPLSKALTLGNVSTAITVSDAINGAVTELARTTAGNAYWQVFLRGSESMLIVNVPSAGVSGTYDQHVMNTRTGAWTRFVGWTATCFAELAGSLYFTDITDSLVFQADTGNNDNSADISATAQQAFTGLGLDQQKKRWTMLRPLVRKDSATDLALGLAVDFEEQPAVASLSGTAGTGVQWDSAEAVWDSAAWATEGVLQQSWQSVYGIGYVASPILKVATQEDDVRWYSTTHMFEVGGVI